MNAFSLRISRLTTPLILLLSMAAAITVSELFYVHASIRLDESQSLWQTSHSFAGILYAVALDVHVPLYHMILHIWQLFVGTSIGAARALSLLFFVASIPAFYLLGREVIITRWARFATVMYALSPFMLWYANEARMYTLLALVAILSQYFFVRILKGKPGWIGYSITAMIGIYVHYFFWFNLIVQGIYFVVNRRQFKKKTFVKLAGLAILLIAELSPWLYYFHKLGSASGTSPRLAAPSTVDFFNALSQFAFGFQTDAVNTVLLSLWPLLMAAGLLFIRTRIRIPQPIAYLLYAGILPITLAFIISITIRPFFISRYMVSCLPALTLVLVWLVSQYPRIVRRGCVGAVVILLAVTSALQITSPLTPVKEDYRQASNFISANASPSDLTILSAPFTVYPFEYNYSFGPAQIRTLPNWYGQVTEGIPGFDKAQLPRQVSQITDGHRNVYLLLSYDQGYEKDIHDYFTTHYQLVSDKSFSRGMTLYVFHITDNPSYDLSRMPTRLKVHPDNDHISNW